MNLKMFSFSFKLIKNNLKRFSVASVLYGMFIFLSATINTVTKQDNEFLSNMTLNFENPVIYMLYFGVPIVLSIFLFRYLHVEKASTFVNSLPFKRSEVFNSNVISGKILLFAPILFNGLIMMIARPADIDKILVWILISFLANMGLFMFGAFVAIITGITTSHVAITVVYLATPMSVAAILNYLFEKFILGYEAIEKVYEYVVRLAPIEIVRMPEYANGTKELLITIATTYIIQILVLYVVSGILYSKRKMEKAGSLIAFKWLEVAFKYVFSLCFALLVFAIFDSITYNVTFGNFTMYIVLVLGGVIGYYISIAMVEKSFLIFRKMKGSIIIAVILTVFFGLIHFDAFGYEKRIPEVENVRKVYLNLNGRYIPNELFEGGYDHNRDYANKNNIFENENVIKSVVNLHSFIVDAETEKRSEENTTYVGIGYQLENGKVMTRRYKIDEVRYYEELKKIQESKDYIMTSNKIFDVDPSEVKEMEAPFKYTFDGTHVEIKDEKRIEQFLSAVKADLITQKYRLNPLSELTVIRIHKIDSDDKDSKKEVYYVPVTSDFEKTIKLFEEDGNKIIFDVNEVESVIAKKYKKGEKIKTETNDFSKIENVKNYILYGEAVSYEYGTDLEIIPKDKRLQIIHQGIHNTNNEKYRY